jgi:hypothetical protein
MCYVRGAHGSELDLAVVVRTEAVAAGKTLVAAAAPRVSRLDVEVAVDSAQSLVAPLVADWGLALAGKECESASSTSVGAAKGCASENRS